jgi:hypothetical protein
MNTEPRAKRHTFNYSFYSYVVIAIGIITGVVLTVLAGLYPPNSVSYDLLTNLGIGLFATAFISMILEFVWSKQRTQAEKAELQPIYDQLKDVPEKLGKLEGRLEAFKQLGFNNCYASRSAALQTFLDYAQEIVIELGGSEEEQYSSQVTINIVSSSARGLVGYLDREPSQIQRAWRELITSNPARFKVLLTHPAFAHLRQPAEERSSGDIELEIIKTAIYLHCVAGMQSNSLRWYRGSPTVFAIQAGEHILVNPYPYGKMAMDTLCLEFERGKESSYVANFMSMHFNHTWAFLDQPSKLVDGKSLVTGIDAFHDIFKAFSECTFLNNPKRLRLTRPQVEELDVFTCLTLPDLIKTFNNPLPEGKYPFLEYVQQGGFICSDQIQDESYNGSL